MMQQPIILTAGGEEKTGTRRFFANRAYDNAVENAGGVLVTIGRPKEEQVIRSLLETADGLLLMGGHDMCPEYYNEKNTHCKNIDRERDDLEVLLIKHAHEMKKPILAICRGLQVMNVAFGGSLYQDISKEMENGGEHDFHKDVSGVDRARDFPAHEIQIVSETLLHKLAASQMQTVNSLHHQGIKKLGQSLVASAHSPDGLIEAVEIENYDYGLGVQWHPEELGDDASRKIFSAFIEAAKKQSK